MDKRTYYRSVIKRLFEEYAAVARTSPNPGIETLMIIDDASDQYLIRHIGWSGHKRIRQTPLHVRICIDKIHVEEDWTEEGIATALLKAGIPKEDIVLAFHPPELRPLTEFAPA